jgi:hypothetical protein
MTTPAIIWLVGTGMTFAVKALRHGQSEKVNVWTYLLLDVPIVAGLLWWGGFFG